MANLIEADKSNYSTGRNGAKIEYIVIHYTGSSNPAGDTAKSNCKYFQTPGREASAHYFVDGQEVYQSVGEGNTAWHCGKDYGGGKAPFWGKCFNKNSLGIEICSGCRDGKYFLVDGAAERAAELVAGLAQTYNIPLTNIIRHYDVCCKNCPAPWVADVTGWLDFSDAVKSLLSVKQKTPQENSPQKNAPQVNTLPHDWAKAAWEWAELRGICDGTNPQAFVTREEVIQMLYNFVKK